MISQHPHLISPGGVTWCRARVIHLLREHGAGWHRNAVVTSIEKGHVLYTLDGEEQLAPGRQVIIAMGAQPETMMADALLGDTSNTASVSSIGDCRKVGYLAGAILDARERVQKLIQA